MKTILNTVALFCIIAVTTFSCSKKTNKNTDCPPVFCTQDLRTISVTVINNSASALPLSMKVKDLNANTIINTVSTPNFGTTNMYSIFGDENMVHINQINIDEPFAVDFILGTNVVKTEVYSVRKDCCHISKSNGADTVTIN